MAEGARLESVCSASYRGFESRPLRKAGLLIDNGSQLDPFWNQTWLIVLQTIPNDLIRGWLFTGAVAQLGRAVRSQRTGRRFDPALLHNLRLC